MCSSVFPIMVPVKRDRSPDGPHGQNYQAQKNSANSIGART